MTTNIRVIREAGGLGDIVRVLAVCQGYRKKYPDARIHFFAASYLRCLLQTRSRALDVLFPCPVQSRPRDCYRTDFAHLNPAGIKYDITYDAWCPAYLHEPATRGTCVLDRTELFCADAGVEFNRPVLTPTAHDLELAAHYRRRHKKIIGIQVGASCPSREWPFVYWQRLIELLRADGNHVILFDVCYRSREGIDFAKVEPSIDRPWSETVGKMLACDLFVTPDSGFFHLTGCFKIPCVGIFTCTGGMVTSRTWQLEQRTHSYVQLPHSEIDYARLPPGCEPICWMQWRRGWQAGRYRLEKGRGHCELAHQTTPERVYAEVKQRLEDIR